MSIADSPRRTMTTEEIFALSDDGIDREIIRGELRERPTIWHTPRHGAALATIAALLSMWLDQRPRPRGMIHCGGAPFQLCRDPESFVAIDVAYASADLVAATGPELEFFDGAPALAVEILAPWDRHDQVVEKVWLYLEVGTVVWEVDPDFRRVSVHRPGRPVETLNETQELSGDPELPGFRVRVAEFFS